MSDRHSYVTTTEEDLRGENASLRQELYSLKQLLVSSLPSPSSSLSEEDKDLRAELSRVKRELESLEVFNLEQSAVGKTLSAEKEKLQADNARLQGDLLRILPLQCEKEKLRKTLEQTASELRALSISQTDLLEQRKIEEARMLRLEEEAVSLRSKEASLTAQVSSTASASAKLQVALDDSLAKLEAEASARKDSDSKVVDVSGELSLERAKTKSQAKEIERLLAIASRQEVLVLKSRLSLREEALKSGKGGEAEADDISMFHDAPSNPPPLPPLHRQQWREDKPSAVLFCMSPRSRCRKAFKQRSLAAQAQGQGQGQGRGLGQDEHDPFPFPQCTGFASSFSEEMNSAGCGPGRLSGLFDYFRGGGAAV